MLYIAIWGPKWLVVYLYSREDMVIKADLSSDYAALCKGGPVRSLINQSSTYNIMAFANRIREYTGHIVCESGVLMGRMPPASSLLIVIGSVLYMQIHGSRQSATP